MAEIPGFLLRHQVTVRRQAGEGSLGDNYGDPITVRCWLNEERKMVRNAGGAEVVSEVQVLCRLAHRADFTLDAEVTLPDGRRVHVISASAHDDAGLGAWQHLEVAC